jgi:uncharacterized BrkB/YihY/UPF0761 family membrane protein
MKTILSAIVLFLISLPLLAATQEANAPPEIEPLSAGYLLFLVAVLVLIFAGFWWYYSRPEPGEDKSKQDQQPRG